jgi:hypothetical protein
VRRWRQELKENIMLHHRADGNIHIDSAIYNINEIEELHPDYQLPVGIKGCIRAEYHPSSNLVVAFDADDLQIRKGSPPHFSGEAEPVLDLVNWSSEDWPEGVRAYEAADEFAEARVDAQRKANPESFVLRAIQNDTEDVAMDDIAMERLQEMKCSDIERRARSTFSSLFSRDELLMMMIIKLYEGDDEIPAEVTTIQDILKWRQDEIDRVVAYKDKAAVCEHRPNPFPGSPE